MDSVGSNRYLDEKRATYAAPRAKSRRTIIILGAIVGIAIIAVAVVVPLYFTVIKNSSSNNNSKSDTVAGSSASPHPSSTPKVNAVTGGDGSTVTREDGSTFTYTNKFGGYWYDDPNDPFNNGARAQSWSPALNETFNWGSDHVRG